MRFCITFYELSFGAIKTRFQLLLKKVQLTSDSQLTFGWSPSSRRVVGRSVRCRPLSTGSVSRRDRVRDGQIRGAGRA